MDYLKKYNITDEEIIDIKNRLAEADVSEDIFLFNPEKVEKILDLFTSIGVKNIFDIIMMSPSMFCDTVSSIKIRLDNYENKEELVNLLNEDAYNLILVDLL